MANCNKCSVWTGGQQIYLCKNHHIYCFYCKSTGLFTCLLCGSIVY